MGSVVVVTTNVNHGIAEPESNSATLNLAFDDLVVYMGDAGTLPGPDIRHALAFVFDLSSGGGIAKTATLTDVKITLTPNATLSLSGGDADHRFALMEPNGQWDRSTDSVLHQSTSGIVYGAPSRQATARSFRGKNEAGSTIFDTSTAAAGFTTFETSAAWPSWGCTFQLPANEILWDMYVDMARIDTGSASNIRLDVYELEGDGRHFAIKSLLASTRELPYSSLVLNTVTETAFTFFGPGFAATTSDRWLAVVVAGDILDDGTIRTTHRLKSRYVTGTSCSSYRGSTEGSLFRVSDVAVNDNSLSDIAYIYSSDVPHIYASGTTTRLTTPYDRVRSGGSVLASSESTVSWTSGTPYNYGTPASGQMNVVTGCLVEFQSWLDSDDYDPDDGKHFLGLMLEPFDPDDELWEVAVASGVACTLELTFRNDTVIHASGSHRARVAAAASSVRERVVSDVDERTRIFVADEARDRVRPTRDKAGGRVRAPESYLRSQT